MLQLGAINEVKKIMDKEKSQFVQDMKSPLIQSRKTVLVQSQMQSSYHMARHSTIARGVPTASPTRPRPTTPTLVAREIINLF